MKKSTFKPVSIIIFWWSIISIIILVTCSINKSPKYSFEETQKRVDYVHSTMLSEKDSVLHIIGKQSEYKVYKIGRTLHYCTFNKKAGSRKLFLLTRESTRGNYNLKIRIDDKNQCKKNLFELSKLLKNL